jgi:hypothetical protein
MNAFRDSTSPALAVGTLSDGDLDGVSGGWFPIVVWAGWHIAVGIAAGIAIAGSSGSGASSPPGDYPTGPKNAG